MTDLLTRQTTPVKIRLDILDGPRGTNTYNRYFHVELVGFFLISVQTYRMFSVYP